MLNGYAVAAAFSTYFCMYAFRKPFAAPSYDLSPLTVFGGQIDQKTLYVISQIIGYALSKCVGVRVCSEAGRAHRLPFLLGLILTAELALVAFGAVPDKYAWAKAVTLLANGMPLGMVWGLVVRYLEGRRVSEVLLTGLSCSYIIASGAVKDVGRALLAGDSLPLPLLSVFGASVPNPLPPVPEFWMPAATGALFFAPFVLSAWLLDQLPEPTTQDEIARQTRSPMGASERHRFLKQYGLGIAAALVAYFLLTAYRDYRDNYMVEVFTEMDYAYEANKTIVSRAELIAAFGVMAILSQLYRINDNRRGLIVTCSVMASGVALVALSTLLMDMGYLSGFWWITLTGVGAYLAYVPFGSVLFDRVMASTRFTGTAVFGIYLADTVGYSGSVLLQLAKGFVAEGWEHLAYLRATSYLVGIVCSIGIVISCSAFLRSRESRPEEPPLTAGQQLGLPHDR